MHCTLHCAFSFVFGTAWYEKHFAMVSSPATGPGRRSSPRSSASSRDASPLSLPSRPGAEWPRCTEKSNVTYVVSNNTSLDISRWILGCWIWLSGFAPTNRKNSWISRIGWWDTWLEIFRFDNSKTQYLPSRRPQGPWSSHLGRQSLLPSYAQQRVRVECATGRHAYGPGNSKTGHKNQRYARLNRQIKCQVASWRVAGSTPWWSHLTWPLGAACIAGH